MLPDSQHRSYWLEDVAGDQPTAEALISSSKADIAILGGGYVGLWTAIRIKLADSSCDIALLEKDICGGGASGRNGGFVLSWWPKISTMVKSFGRSDGLSIVLDSELAINEIKTFCDENAIDCHFRKSGWLWTATSEAQMNSWESVVRLSETLGAKVFQRLTSDEIAARTGSRAHRAGVLDITAATVHPARLARGLRKVALDLGVRIYENTEVRSFTRSRPVVIKTQTASLTSEKLIIANNAWAAGIRELSNAIVAITSDMIMTAPAEEMLREVGWTGGECIADSQMMVDYYQVTKSSRIAFGKGGWGIAYGGRLGVDFDRNTSRAKTVESDFRRYYPTFKDVPITHDWCGPIDRTPFGLPVIGRFKHHPNILYGVGWSGNGVGPSVIGGKVLASMALEHYDRWGRYPLINTEVGRFPPEPIRWVGAHIVRSAVVCREKAEIEDKKPSKISVLLSKLAPVGLEDKN